MSKSIYTRTGLFDLSDGVTKGKGVSSLLDSRDKRADLFTMFGGRDNVPSSVMPEREHYPRADMLIGVLASFANAILIFLI